MLLKMLNDCAAKEGATDADKANTIARKPVTTQGEKCIRACIGETLGLV